MERYILTMIRTFIYQTPGKDHSDKIVFGLVLITLFAAFGTCYYWYIHAPKKNATVKIISPLVNDVGRMLGLKKDSAGLKLAIDRSLEGSAGTYGIVINNLTTDQHYYHLEDRRFQTASIYKLWVMAEAFQEIQEGRLKEDEVLSEEIPTLNEKFHIASGDAELTEGVVRHTVTDALEKMVVYSDNYSALLLTARVKVSNLQTFLEENHFKDSSTGQPPVTTANDVALFFEKLYNGELADDVYTAKMLDLLKRQAHNDKLPKYLPDGIVMAHKTGEMDTFAHDGGIVYSPKGDYIIVVLSESKATSGASDRIGQISQAAYEYFQKAD